MKFNSLMVQFIIGAAIMVACVVVLSFSQNEVIHTQKTLTDWQAQADKIQLDIANLQQQAQHYKLNAPRDFDSYNRDVEVFYQQFKQQLATLNRTFTAANNSVMSLTDSISYSWLTQADSPLLKAIQKQSAWHSFWQIFVEELDTQIGSPQEPRLEWGAEYIINNQEKLIQQAVVLATQIHQASDWFSSLYRQANTVMIGFVLACLLISLSYFALRIIRPVLSTTRACEEVAGGNYGKKVELNGSGETRRLQHAFNELSARSKLFMDMLGDIYQPGDVRDKLQCIYNSGREALGTNWIGLMAFNENNVDLNSSVPASLDVNFRHRHVSLHKAFGKELMNTLDNGWLNIESLRQLSLNRHDERFLRELHKNTMATQIVGYPFRCPKHHNFILMFSSNRKGGFSRQQTELIKALAKLMADAIISGMDQEPRNDIIAGEMIPLS